MSLSPFLSPRLTVPFQIEDMVLSPSTSSLSSTCQTAGSPSTPPSRGSSPFHSFLKVESSEHLLSFESDFDIFGDSLTHKESLLSESTKSPQIVSALADIEYFFLSPTTAERGHDRFSPPSPSRWQGEDSRGVRGQRDSSVPRSSIGFDRMSFPCPIF